MKTNNDNPCECDICKLGRVIESIAERCSEEEKAVLDEVWSRMGDAETSLDEIIAIAQEGSPMVLSGRTYHAQDEEPIQPVLRCEPGNN